MNHFSNQLEGLRRDDPDVALVLDAFGEIERVYRETLEAMGVTGRHAYEVTSSAEMIISFQPTASSSDY